MAQLESLLCITRPAGADLSAVQYRFVEVGTTGKVTQCNAAGEDALGVLQDNPAATDRAAQVAIFGMTKVVAGGTVAAKDKVTTDNQGRGVTAASGNHVLGTCITGGAVGEIIEVLLGSNHILA